MTRMNSSRAAILAASLVLAAPAACTSTPENSPEPEPSIAPEALEGELPIESQGSLEWADETPFLMDGSAAMSWLFTLTEHQRVSFTLTSLSKGDVMRARVRRWDPEAGDWTEALSIESSADAQRSLELTRELDEGFYWLILSRDPVEVATPYVLLAECDGAGCTDNTVSFSPEPLVTRPQEPSGSVAVGLSDDFRAWLERSAWSEHDFARGDVEGGSFGGRIDPNEARVHDPVIFVHGNSDRALGGPLGGWSESVAAFERAGYAPGELFATTWGPANAALASAQYHSRDNVLHVRAFIEAVLEYTGAERVDVITHSMGVTLARRAIMGGEASDLLANPSDYAIGEPLSARVDTFVGIAGANRGLVACAMTGPSSPTCGMTNGLYPGAWSGRGARSQLLRALDERAHYEGDHVFSIWSPTDEIINPVGRGSLVWGEVTSRVAEQDGEVVFEDEPTSHLETRDLSAEAQVELVREHDSGALAP